MANTKKDTRRGWIPGLTLAGGLGLLALELNNRRLWRKAPPLDNPLTGIGHFHGSPSGLVFYKEAGPERPASGSPPVVFVHGIGAGASSYQWFHNFAEFAREFHCYAYDLLGFGNSERPPIRYTAETYVYQLAGFLENVVKEPACVVGSSLSASHAVQVAFRRPHLIKKLLLVMPDGGDAEKGGNGPQLSGRFSYPLLRAPVIGKAIFSFVGSRSSIRSFLKGQFYFDGAKATGEEVDQYWISAHQPCSHYAPPSFFAGLLNSELYSTIEKIEQPVLMVWGRESRITPLDKADELLDRNKKAQVLVFDSARLGVNQEHPEQFNRVGLAFLRRTENWSEPDYQSASAI